MPLSNVRPDQYPALLREKCAVVAKRLSPFSPPPPEVFASEPTGFRLRAEFRIWHDGDELNYVMFSKDDPRTPVPLTEFPIAAPNIQSVMPMLRELLKGSDILRRKLFQVEFMSTLSGDMLITLIYHRRLDESWEQAASDLIRKLQSLSPSLALVGRSRKQKVVLGLDYVIEDLTIHERRFQYQQYEQSFTQPNGEVNIKMIEWACERSKSCSGNLLELYCGNGNFTLPLSLHFDHIIATELSKSSVRAARYNLERNNIDNVHLVRLSAEEVTQAMKAERVFRRLRELPKPLDQFDLRTIFVDPPRAGLDQLTVQMASGFSTILYISCNPVTLAENLEVLCQTHAIEHLAMFDQFPYTEHMECGVVLQSRT